MAGKNAWTFAELEAMNVNDLNDILAEIPSDGESIADDYLSGDEDEIDNDVLGTFDKQNISNNTESSLQDAGADSDDEPLSRVAERLRNTQGTGVPVFSSVDWSKDNCYQEPPCFDFSNDVDMDEVIERPVDVFLCLFPEDLLESIVFNTNLYATEKQMNGGNNSFQPTTIEEMKVFIGINLLMGIKKLPSLKDYWSSQEEIRDAFISRIIPRDRFYWLLSNLHFADNTVQPKKGESNFDKLYKLGPLLTTLSQTYRNCYSPGEFQAVDESMIKYKGRSCMKQYMPAKPTKRGYKVWVRADDSGYICEFQIYTGKLGDLPEKDLGGRAVRDLTRYLRNKNPRIFFDNYFTSVPLLWDLKQNNIYACGTLKKGKKYLPGDFTEDKKLARGQYDWRMSDDGLVCLKWKDKKPVYFLSNYHDPEDCVTTKRRNKDGTLSEIDCPSLVADYNKHICAVDKAEMLKKFYAIDRKSKKWYHRIVWHFLDTTVVNAYILFTSRASGLCLDFKQFRINIASGLIESAWSSKKKGRKSVEAINNYKISVPIEKRTDKAAHMPVYSTSRRCTVCSTRNEVHRSMWSCITCRVGLCLNDKRNCFSAYHSIE